MSDQSQTKTEEKEKVLSTAQPVASWQGLLNWSLSYA
jgi:hypothetical protein